MSKHPHSRKLPDYIPILTLLPQTNPCTQAVGVVLAAPILRSV